MKTKYEFDDDVSSICESTVITKQLTKNRQ